MKSRVYPTRIKYHGGQQDGGADGGRPGLFAFCVPGCAHGLSRRRSPSALDLNMNMRNITPSLLCAIALIALMATSCSVTVDPPATAMSQADLVKTPSFQATVVRVENGNAATGGNQVDACFVAAILATTNGSRICIGGPNASPEMIAFVRGLHKRQVCTLPEAFIASQKSQAQKKQ